MRMVSREDKKIVFLLRWRVFILTQKSGQVQDGLLFIIAINTGCLQLLEIPEVSWNLKSLLEILEISWNIIDAPAKFNCQLQYDNMPVTAPNLSTNLSGLSWCLEHCVS